MLAKSVPEDASSLDRHTKVAIYSAWYNREMCLHFWNQLDSNVKAWKLDDLVSPAIKEGWSKRSDPNCHEIASHSMDSKMLHAALAKIPPVECRRERRGKGETWSEAADSYGKFIQLKCVGFLENKRQHRQFGLGIIEASQLIMSRREGGQTWRECFDVLVKWRQVSEPNDPVWWVDQLSRNAFEEGFGLQTPIVSGELKVFRYYPYFERAFALLKKLTCKQCELDKESRAVVEAAGSLDELWAIVKEDFWVVAPCKSHSTPRGVVEMEGTRLTLQKWDRENKAENFNARKRSTGYNFTIRTPGTPKRFAQFSQQLDVLWDKLFVQLGHEEVGGESKGKGGDHKDDDDNDDGGGDDDDVDGRGIEATKGLVEIALLVFYYWVCFAPLTRGSAAVGYGMMLAILRCGGITLLSMPEGVQLDWEAILAESSSSFVEQWAGWMSACATRDKWVRHRGHNAFTDDLGRISLVLPTLRSRLEALGW